MRDFAKRVHKAVADALSARGLRYAEGAFVRTLDTGLRQGMCFDNQGRNSSAYRVMLFVNVVELDDPTPGGHLVRYFTGGSISTSPRDLSCRTVEALDGSLNRVSTCLELIFRDFFEEFSTPSRVADALADEPFLEDYRGRLRLMAGDAVGAASEFDSYLERLETTPTVTTSELEKARDEVRRLLEGG